jgi:hypothetical protein
MEDEQTRARVAALLATPEMQRAMQELSGGLTQGVVKGLSSDEMSVHMNKLVGQFLRAIMSELARGLNDDLGPALTAITGRTIDAAFDSALSAQHQQQIDRFTAAIVGSVLRATAQEIPQSLAPAMHKAMLEDVGPAIREMMHKDLAPGMSAMIRSPDFKAALGETTREVAHQAVLGSNEGLAELAEKRKNDNGGMPLGVVGAFFAKRTWLLVALVTAVVFSIPLLWLARERRLARRFRADAERRNARAAALLGAMEAAPDGAWSSKLLDMLREQLLEETTSTRREDLEPPQSGAPGQRPHHA